MEKYIFVNGVMTINPEFTRQQQNQGNPSTLSAPNQALAIVSTPEDIFQASVAQQNVTQQPITVSQNTINSLQEMQSAQYASQFQAPNKINSQQLIDGLTNIFAKYEVPIGLINKLKKLSEFQLNFIVDDSGSMVGDSDVRLSQASTHIKQQCRFMPSSSDRFLTRWEEAQDRIHVMIDMLAFIPTGNITLTFLNSDERLEFSHRNKSPEEFAQEAHQKLYSMRTSPNGCTPIYQKLSAAFNQTTVPTMHYLFTDGEPTGGVPQVEQLVKTRNAA